MSDRTIESLEASEAMRKEIERLRAELAEKDAAIAQAYEDGRISACNAGKPGCPRAAASEAELAAVRALMDTYNVGGWTDAIEPMKRALAAEAACAQMREALQGLEDWLADCDDPELVDDYDRACGAAAAALATDAGRGYVSTEGAVEAEVMPMPLSNGNAALAAVIPADWIGHTVLIIRKPEDE